MYLLIFAREHPRGQQDQRIREEEAAALKDKKEFLKKKSSTKVINLLAPLR
jgi:oligoendopeptidase F